MSGNSLRSFAWRGFATLGFATGGVVTGAFFAATTANAQGSNPCAIYGAGFVSVHGGDTCVRIGGRVRVDAGVVGGTTSSSDPRVNFAPSTNPFDETDRSHLRLQGGAQNGMPRTR